MVLSNPRNPCLLLCLVLSAASAQLAPAEDAGQSAGARLAVPSAGASVGTSLLDGDCSASGFDLTNPFSSSGTVTGPPRACAQEVRRSA